MSEFSTYYSTPPPGAGQGARVLSSKTQNDVSLPTSKLLSVHCLALLWWVLLLCKAQVNCFHLSYNSSSSHPPCLDKNGHLPRLLVIIPIIPATIVLNHLHSAISPKARVTTPPWRLVTCPFCCAKPKLDASIWVTTHPHLIPLSCQKWPFALACRWLSQLSRPPSV